MAVTTKVRYTWPYTTPDGSIVGEIRRLVTDGKKDDIPCCIPKGDGFEPGIPDAMKKRPYPLLASKIEPGTGIFVVEGQKVRQALATLGMPAVTSILGAHNAKKSDWSPLKVGRTIVIAPDNDEDGEVYARDVVGSLSEYVSAADRILILRVPDLPEKGDLVDWLQLQNELRSWDGYESLENHPCRSDIRNRLKSTLSQWLQPVPPEWLTKDNFTGYLCSPRPLQRVLAPAAEYPVDALGPVLSGMVRVLTDVNQTPPAMVAQSLLAAVSLAVQAHGDVLIDGRKHPTSLYMVTLAVSGERKSAIDKIALKPHQKYRKQLMKNFQAEETKYTDEKDAYEKARLDVIRAEKGRSPAEITEAIKQVGEKPTKPTNPSFLCEEPTYEALVKMFIQGRPSLGLFSDEGGRFLGGHAMNEDNILKTSAGLSKIWDGAPIDRARVGEGNALLFGRRLAMHLMIQPMFAPLLISNRVLVDQGLASRLLVSFPRSTQGSRWYRQADATESREYKTYFGKIMDILECPLPLASDAKDELDPLALTLTTSAKDAWIAFHDEVEAELKDDGLYAPIRGFAAKAAEQALRIAGVLALFEDLRNEVLSAYHVESGIELMQFYLHEALRLFDTGATDPEMVRIQQVLDWLHSREEEMVTVSECYQKGPRCIRNAKSARKALEMIYEHGWIRPGPDDGDRRKREIWFVRKDIKGDRR